METMTMYVDIPDNKNKYHQLKIHLPESEDEKKAALHYRYEIYHDHGYLKPNSQKIDQDVCDKKCVQLLATFDDQIVGAIRLIHGDTIPTIDLFYCVGLPSSLTDIPKEQLIEISRVISSPHRVTQLIPRHFVLMAMAYYISELSKKNNIRLILGTLKRKTLTMLQRIKFPIHEISDATFNTRSISRTDPWIDYFDSNKTGEFCPIFIDPTEGSRYIENIYSKKFVFEKLSDYHFALKDVTLFKALMLSKIFI